MVLAIDLGLVRNLDFLNLNTDVLVFTIFALKMRCLLSFHVSVDIVMNLCVYHMYGTALSTFMS